MVSDLSYLFRLLSYGIHLAHMALFRFREFPIFGLGVFGDPEKIHVGRNGRRFRIRRFKRYR